MSDRCHIILTESRYSGNFIPSGRQLTRTPPLCQVKRQLDFCSEDLMDGTCFPTVEPQQNMEQADQDQLFSDPDRTFDFNTPEQKQGSQQQLSSTLNRTMDINYSQTKDTLQRSRTGSTICSANIPVDDPNSMLKGMEGYKLTQNDLEFIEKMKQEKHIKKLQGDLAEVQRLLNSETMALDLALASKENAQAELTKFPSCEELIDLARMFLQTTLPSTEVMELDPKSLLARVKKDDVQRAIAEKRDVLAQMETMVADKRKKEEKETGQQEKRILSKQLKIQGMMSELSNLKSELAKVKETYEALQMKINTLEAAEIQVEVEGTEEVQATKSQVRSPKPQGRTRKADKMVETLHDTTNQSKPTKRNLRARGADSKADSQPTLKDDHGTENTHEALKTSTKEPTKHKSRDAKQKLTKSAKAAKTPQRKVKEQESNSQESLQAARGRRKPPETAKTAASQEKAQSKVNSGKTQSASPPRKKVAFAADEAAEAQNAGLRRSKRIASKR